MFYITPLSFILFIFNRIIGLYLYLPFTKLAILDNGTNKKQAIFALSIKLLQFIMEKDFQIPTSEAIESLIGKGLYQIWNALCLLIEHKYEMEQLWNNGGRKWKYEYKYRRGRKTLCALYAKENPGSVVILGGITTEPLKTVP